MSWIRRVVVDSSKVKGARCLSSSRRGPFDILFCGTDAFSVITLEAVLAATDVWSSIHVLTPAEQRHGRGHSKLFTPPLAEFAQERGLPHTTYSSELLSTSAERPGSFGFRGQHQDSSPSTSGPSSNILRQFSTPNPSNLLITSSFGHLLTNSFLRPFHPSQRLNVHPSLLPEYRGAAPIQWVIANGETSTGVTVQSLAEIGKGVDAGDIFGQIHDIPISNDETTPSILPRLAQAGGDLLVDVLRQLLAGEETMIPQDSGLASRAPKIVKETAHIHWRYQSSLTIDRLHRAIGHQQPLWTETDGISVQFMDLSAIPVDDVPLALRSHPRGQDYNPGRAFFDTSPAGRGERLLIPCIPHNISEKQPWMTHKAQGNSWIQVKTVKPAMNRIMSVKDWWNGVRPREKQRNWLLFKSRKFGPEAGFISGSGQLKSYGMMRPGDY